MESFAGKLAVITGGGTGMGRELAKQLIAEGCDVAICDVIDDNMAETVKLCEAEAPQGIRITAHRCDVSNEEDVKRFRDEVIEEHKRDHVNLLFNNAGIGGVLSFINDPREDWERTFNICWYGVYYCTRAFMPLMVASEEAHLINTSSINGFWASLGPSSTHTAYSAAKFAVKGFSEALISDLKLNAPHINVSVVMPGHIGTSIAINTGRLMDRPAALDMSAEQVAAVRKRMTAQGVDVASASDDQIRQFIKERGESFRDNAPTTAAEAAAEMLKGVREKRWRILLGDDARILDEMVRENPEAAYDDQFAIDYPEKAAWQLG